MRTSVVTAPCSTPCQDLVLQKQFQLIKVSASEVGSSDESSSESELGDPQILLETLSRNATESINDAVSPQTSSLDKLREAMRLSSTRARMTIKEIRKPYQPLSEAGRFTHYLVEPLGRWWGKNDRILLSQPLSTVNIQEERGSISVINGASHNYIGTYKWAAEAEELHRLCLDKLPLTGLKDSNLEKSVGKALADFFSMDFCYTTSTGYGSNLLAFSALLDRNWLLVMDEKCHSSMFTGGYLGSPAAIKKFKHNDMAQLEFILRDAICENVLVAVEGFYSMDGTIPQLDRLCQLKERYSFTLLCDEAHSFLSIGKTGRGCVEMWNDQHPDTCVPEHLIDVRTGTVSKAVGCIGGFVCGTSEVRERVRSRAEELYKRGDESLSAPTMVQTLYVLGQQSRIESRLQRLREITEFSKAELRRFGIHVYGRDTPTLPVHTGRPSWAAKLSYRLRKLGVLGYPVATPAVSFWEARVRIILSADFSNDQVNMLVSCIIEAMEGIGIIRKCNLQRRVFNAPEIGGEVSNHEASTYVKNLILQDAETYACSKSASSVCRAAPAVIEAGHVSRARYGVGSGGARWIGGTFLPHLQVEALIAKATGCEAAMIWPASNIGLATTIAALCRPILGFAKHHLLVPAAAGTPTTLTTAVVHEGLLMAPKKGAPVVHEYASLDDMFAIAARLEEKSYLTLYLGPIAKDGACGDLTSILARLGSKTSHMTVLMHDSGRVGATYAPQPVSSRSPRVLIHGSFHGLAGGYVAGDTTSIDELRYTCRGYMYTSSQPPFVMDMVGKSIELQLEETEDHEME